MTDAYTYTTSYNYTIITSLPNLQSFVDWLPICKPGETYYVGIFARNKYAKAAGIGTFGSDKHHCKRFTTTTDRLIEKLYQCESPIGSYTVKNGIVVPQEAIACYISINPRDMIKATRLALVRFAELIAQNATHHNPHQEVLTAIHKSVGTKYFLDIDFDGVDPESVMKQIAEAINLEAVNILRTRGGFHAIVRLDMVDPNKTKTWYKKIMTLPGVDIRGDNLVPIPGTYQGGFTPNICPSIIIEQR